MPVNLLSSRLRPTKVPGVKSPGGIVPVTLLLIVMIIIRSNLLLTIMIIIRSDFVANSNDHY